MTDAEQPTPPTSQSSPRRRYRAPTGLPARRQRWSGGAVLSLVIHGVLLLLLINDFTRTQLIELAQGAGGPGPAGGGGGGNRGSGVQHEKLEYVVVAPSPAEVVAPPPVVPPEPVPVPQIQFNPPPTPQIELPKLTAPLPITGIGGGTGSDASGGTGPGSGGGVGSGVGTGRGSAVGPGTGGGGEENYPPTPIEMFIPPLPVPASARGAHVIAHFDVDERGRVRGIEFTPTRDRGYNRRLREALEGYRFRPGTRPDGTPIRMKAQITIDLP